MNLLLFTDSDRVATDRITVRDERLRHLRDVNALSKGQRLRVGEVDGLLGEGRVIELSRNRALLEVTLDTAPPAKLPAILVLALPRPKMLRRILRSVAEFGIAELHIINSYRVQKSYWQTPVLAPAAIRDHLLQGLAQGIDTVLPPVYSHTRFKPFVEDTLPQLLQGRRAILAQPGAATPCPAQVSGGTLLAVGPEGGFTDYEVGKLLQAGCEPVTLGPRILRVENAVSRLLGRIL